MYLFTHIIIELIARFSCLCVFSLTRHDFTRRTQGATDGRVRTLDVRTTHAHTCTYTLPPPQLPQSPIKSWNSYLVRLSVSIVECVFICVL